MIGDLKIVANSSLPADSMFKIQDKISWWLFERKKNLFYQ